MYVFFDVDSESKVSFRRSPIIFSYKNVLGHEIGNEHVPTSDLGNN